METKSLGLLQDGTKDLETEGGRTSSWATAPEIERDYGDDGFLRLIASVAPAATAGCGSTGKPDAAFGEASQ